jgi:hypothetical protein
MLGIEVQATAEEVDGGLEVLPVAVTTGPEDPNKLSYQSKWNVVFRNSR